MSQRWLIYALGGGLGHLVRGLALARAAERKGVSVRLLTNSPFASAVPLEHELSDGECVVIDPSADRAQVAARVRCELEERRNYDLLVVDTFPRGLGGELAELDVPAPRALVHRDITPAYVERFDLEVAVRAYNLVLLPGERGPLAGDDALETAPWLIRDAGELASPDEARAELGADERPLVGVVASGKEEEAVEVRELTERLARNEHIQMRLFDDRWPLLRWLPGVDLLVGSGGYNTVYEARAVGVPLLAVPRPRLYDRQDRRLRPEERVTPAELVTRVAEARRNHVAPPAYTNGVHTAVDALRRPG